MESGIGLHSTQGREPARCPHCATPIGPGAKFCVECGHRFPLDPDASPVAGAAMRAGPTAATERRQITVVFCDLVDSTRLSAEIDAEDLTEVIGQFQRAVTRAMNEFGGYVARYLGDGTLVTFGYPRAQEDDPERAIRAALRAIEAVSEITLPEGRRMQAHVGIATGLVVVGDIAGVGTPLGLDVAGATPNVAARLEALAPPGAVFVTETTRKLAGSGFQWRDLGPVTLKGVAEPMVAYEVAGLVGTPVRRHRGAFGPMIDREAEKSALRAAWQRAQQGQGGIVVVSGEPGIGKSRLTEEFLRDLEHTPHARLRYFCSSHRQNSPLYPVIQHIEYASGFARDDTPETRLAKLEKMVGDIPAQDLGLIADLLLLPTGNRFPTVQFAPQKRLERLMDALIRPLERAARDKPLLAVLEDAHWSDLSTRELVGMFAQRVVAQRMLLIVTTRPGLQAPWLDLPQTTRILLSPLRAEESALFVERIAGADALPRSAVDNIVLRTDGVPLYLEEMTLAVVESGRGFDVQAGSGTRPTVPVSLQASLLARLDHLGEVREIAEIAAAIGRDFTRELLTAVADRPQQDIDHALDRLVDSGLCVRRATFDAYGTGFSFRHMLIRDSAYNIMVRETRKAMHARIADVLETRFADRAAANPEIVALHCTEGGMVEKAGQYWLAAGVQALRRSAMMEALAHLARGMEVIRAMPDGDARRRRELDLAVALGKAQIATQGYAVDGTGETYQRAFLLCEQLGEPPQLLSVLHGLWTHALMRADLAGAKQQALDVLARGEQHHDDLMLLMGYRFSGVTHHPLGAFADARGYLERGIERYDPAQVNRYAMITVDDPEVVMLTYLSWSLMCMGELDEARRRGAQALEHARRLAHAYTVAHALNGASFLALTIDSPRAALDLLDQLMPLLEEHGITYYGAVGTLFRGWCLAALGDAAEAESLLQRGMQSYRATGSRLYLPGFLRMSAEAYGRSGREPAVAMQQIHEAFHLMYSTSQRWDEAEMHRVHGGLLLADADVDGAASALRRALAIARAQGAGLWELRAATDLARLDAERGERGRAGELLRPVCARFDTQSECDDLIRARSLLNSLQ